MDQAVAKKNPTQLAISVVGNHVLASHLKVSRSSVTTWDKQGYVPSEDHRRKVVSLAKQSGLNVSIEMLNKDYESQTGKKEKGA